MEEMLTHTENQTVVLTVSVQVTYVGEYKCTVIDLYCPLYLWFRILGMELAGVAPRETKIQFRPSLFRSESERYYFSFASTSNLLLS